MNLMVNKMTGQVDEITISIFLELGSPLAVKMVSTSDDKQDNITFLMIGLPAYDIKAYDLEEKIQRIRGNNMLPRGKQNTQK